MLHFVGSEAILCASSFGYSLNHSRELSISKNCSPLSKLKKNEIFSCYTPKIC
jgi:hypothetical protein